MADKTKLGTEKRILEKETKLKQYVDTSASGKPVFVDQKAKGSL